MRAESANFPPFFYNWSMKKKNRYENKYIGKALFGFLERVIYESASKHREGVNL